MYSETRNLGIANGNETINISSARKHLIFELDSSSFTIVKIIADFSHFILTLNFVLLSMLKNFRLLCIFRIFFSLHVSPWALTQPARPALIFFPYLTQSLLKTGKKSTTITVFKNMLEFRRIILFSDLIFFRLVVSKSISRGCRSSLSNVR